MALKLVAGDYVVATKYSDGDPQDHWVVGFFSGVFGDRYMVCDGEGKEFRGNGFRRIKKITQERGKFLLDHAKDIELGTRPVWWWVRRSIKG